MLKTRIIPTMLWRDTTLVKGEKFESARRTGTVLPTLKVYNRRQVDELIIVDITATNDGRRLDFDAIRDFSADCFVPLTIGGGIRSIEDIRETLRAGADKIALNSVLYENPDLVAEAASKFGAQCIVASIDVKREADGSLMCYSHSGKKSQNKDLVTWAKELEALGAGEILLTSIDRDGCMAGYDIAMTRMVSDAVSLPVIASGGAGNYAHMLDALNDGGASAVAAASIFHFTEQTPLEAKSYLAERGIPVRSVWTY
jgi:cyclase